MSRTGNDLVGKLAVYENVSYIIKEYDDGDKLYLLYPESNANDGLPDDANAQWVERTAFLVPEDDVPVIESVKPPLYVESERVYIPDAQAYGIIVDNEKRDDDGVRLYSVKVGNEVVERREDSIVRDVLPKMSAAQKLAVIERYFMDVIEEAGQNDKISHLSLSVSADGNPNGNSSFELKFRACVNYKEDATTDDLFRSLRIAALRKAENDANKPRLLPKL